MKTKIIKLLEKNLGNFLCDLGLLEDLSGTTPKVWPIKENVDKLDFVKFKIVCYLKYTDNKIKDKPLL